MSFESIAVIVFTTQLMGSKNEGVWSLSRWTLLSILLDFSEEQSTIFVVVLCNYTQKNLYVVRNFILQSIIIANSDGFTRWKKMIFKAVIIFWLLEGEPWERDRTVKYTMCFW